MAEAIVGVDFGMAQVDVVRLTRCLNGFFGTLVLILKRSYGRRKFRCALVVGCFCSWKVFRMVVRIFFMEMQAVPQDLCSGIELHIVSMLERLLRIWR
jgi:hypothetical protein